LPKRTLKNTPSPRWAKLQQRQVLEGGSVEDHVGPSLVEQAAEEVDVADVTRDEIVRVEQGPSVDGQLHGVQAALVAVEHDELGEVCLASHVGELGEHLSPGAGDGDQDGLGLVAFCHLGHPTAIAEDGDPQMIRLRLSGSSSMRPTG